MKVKNVDDFLLEINKELWKLCSRLDERYKVKELLAKDKSFYI